MRITIKTIQKARIADAVTVLEVVCLPLGFLPPALVVALSIFYHFLIFPFVFLLTVCRASFEASMTCLDFSLQNACSDSNIVTRDRDFLV